MVAGTASLFSLLFFVFMSASGELKNITAEYGQNVTLPCRAPNNNIAAVKWTHLPRYWQDKYVLLYEGGRAIPYNQHPFFKYRVALQDRRMKDGDVSLILRDVKIRDAGTYECGVQMKETQSWENSFIDLHVVRPDEKFIDAKSGQDITLTCRAPSNNKGVKWSRDDLRDKYVLLYRNGQFETDKQDPSFKNWVDLQDRQMKDGDVSLLLKDVTVIDEGIYECYVFMEETDSPKLISIIRLHVQFPERKIITPESGQDVTLPCRAPYNNKGVKWWRVDPGHVFVLVYQSKDFVSDEKHPSFKNRVDMKDGDASLILKGVTTNDTGMYECRLSQEVRGPIPILSSIQLHVIEPNEETITAESGQDVTLTCRAPNNNTEFVVWSRADLRDKYVLLYQDGHSNSTHQHPSFKNRVDLQDRQMKDGDVSLILRDVTTDDTGIYECGGMPFWHTFMYLRVVAPPGQTGGDTEDGGKKDGSVGLKVGLPVSVVLFFIVVVSAAVGFLIYRRCKLNPADPHVAERLQPEFQKTITAESGQDVTLTCRAPNSE